MNPEDRNLSNMNLENLTNYRN